MNPYTYVPVTVPDVADPQRLRRTRVLLRWMRSHKRAVFLMIVLPLILVWGGLLTVAIFVVVTGTVFPSLYGYRRNRYGRFYRESAQRETRNVRVVDTRTNPYE